MYYIKRYGIFGNDGKNPKTKVLPLTREQMGVIKEWCVFSTNALSQLIKLVHLLIQFSKCDLK